MRAKKVKCQTKMKGKCGMTGAECDHAVLHKRSSFCEPLSDTCDGCAVPPKKK